MPAVVVVGAIGAAASYGAAAAAVGALATAGTAALTVGAVASIATFVGSVAVAVGGITNDKNLLRIGSIVGVAGGLTGVAANAGLFGAEQTLAASVNTANAAATGVQLTAAQGGVGAGIASAPDISQGVQIVNPTTSTSGNGLLGVTGGAPTAGQISSGLTTQTTQAATAAETASAAQAGGSGSLIDYSLTNAPSSVASSTATDGVHLADMAKAAQTVNSPLAPEAAVPTANKFSFDAMQDFFRDNKELMTQIGAGVNSYMQNEKNEALENYYKQQIGLARDRYETRKHNASAAARLYGG